MNPQLLRESLEKSNTNLEEIGNWVSRTINSSLPEECFDFFRNFESHLSNLSAALQLLEVRSASFDIVQQIGNGTLRDPENPENLKYLNLSIPFWQARFLSIQSHIGTTWAMYEQISKVAGNLVCAENVVKNTIQPHKITDYLNKGEKIAGSNFPSFLKKSYGWPIGVSYAIRNWMIHDGETSYGIKFFSDEIGSKAPFELTSEAISQIERKCHSDYKVDPDQSRRPEFWPHEATNLIGLIKICHEEIDEAASIYISWATSSVKELSKLIFRRDIE